MRSHNKTSHTVNRDVDLFKVRTPHPFAADLNMLMSRHTRSADLNAAKRIRLDIAYPPPEHGAGEGPEEYENFPENQ